jgi:uncharacterized protein
MNSTIEIYYRLRDEVDRKAAVLEQLHEDWMACKKGCSSCCMNLTVWPVEFFAIMEEIKASGWPLPQLNNQTECAFLDKKEACQIYPFRPIICRTHGLPLVYWQEDHEPPAHGVIFCEKNFASAGEMEYTAVNTLNMDEVNEKLARINLVFLDEENDPLLQSDTRIELRKLLEYL